MPEMNRVMIVRKAVPVGWVALILWAVVAVACADRDGREDQHRARLAVFGTSVEIIVRGPNADRAAQAIGVIDRDFQFLHRHWHAWEPGFLVDLNQALARGEVVEIDAMTADLIGRSIELSRQSGGRFDPAIGGLLGLWGFQSSELPVGPPPRAELIDRWLSQAPSMGDVRLAGQTLRSLNPAVRLDFGAVAKGYAIDRAIERLRALGVAHAIVNAGGDVRVIGQAAGRQWRVAIRHPGRSGMILATLAAADGEAVFTSGNYVRFRRDRALRYAHILDPRSGWPVEGVRSVTVVDGSGTRADAAATALVVAGVEDWPEVAAAMAVEAVMLVDDQGTVWMSPAMAGRIEFEAGPSRVEVRSLPSGD